MRSKYALGGAFIALIFMELFHPKRWRQNVAVMLLILVVFSGVVWWGSGLQFEKASKALTTTASWNPVTCADPDFPVTIELTNIGTRPLRAIVFTLEAHQPGEEGDRIYTYRWDKNIDLPTGIMELRCLSIPSFDRLLDPADVVWSARPVNVSFR